MRTCPHPNKSPSLARSIPLIFLEIHLLQLITVTNCYTGKWPAGLPLPVIGLSISFSTQQPEWSFWNTNLIMSGSLSSPSTWGWDLNTRFCAFKQSGFCHLDQRFSVCGPWTIWDITIQDACLKGNFLGPIQTYWIKLLWGQRGPGCSLFKIITSEKNLYKIWKHC